MIPATRGSVIIRESTEGTSDCLGGPELHRIWPEKTKFPYGGLEKTDVPLCEKAKKMLDSSGLFRFLRIT